MRKEINLISLLFVFSIQISACGQTGDLYLPDKKQTVNQMVRNVYAELS